MGMSTHISGLKPIDDDWRKMKAVYDACEAAGIDIPHEVDEFFDCREPDEKGVHVDLPFNNYDNNDSKNHPAISKGSDSSSEWWDVEINSIPPDVKIIRFLHSW